MSSGPTAITAVRPRPRSRATFPPHSDLRADLNAEVDAYFLRTGLDRAGGLPMCLKTAAIFLWIAASWSLLLFWASSPWTVIPLCFSLAFALAGGGFAIMHDGGHDSYSSRPLVNRLAAAVLDLLGASSFFWNQKHNVLHHTYTNVQGLDTDIELRPFFRLTRSQKRYFFHRLQFIYWVPLFVFFTTKWILVDDLVSLITGKVGPHPLPRRPRGGELLLLLAGKVSFITYAIVVPLLFVPVVPYLLAYVLVSTVWGLTMGLVFQLAHAVEGAEFHDLPESGALPRPFAEHQLATTVDFARHNRPLTWYLGGLNHQVEHHLYPRVGHRHYPALAEIVRAVCKRHGITPLEHPTVLSGLRAHLRHLWELGKPVSV